MNNIIKLSEFQGPMSLVTAENYGKLLEPVFRVKDIKIDSKIYHTWRMAGLVDTVENSSSKLLVT